jgi:hypothetical protein
VEREQPVSAIHDIYNLVSDVDIIRIRIGFAQVKNNKGALTPGSTPDTADNFTNRKLYELSHNLKSGSRAVGTPLDAFMLKNPANLKSDHLASLTFRTR